MTTSVAEQLAALRAEVGTLRRENARLLVALTEAHEATAQARHERDMSRGKAERLKRRLDALLDGSRGDPQRGQDHAKNLHRVLSPSGQEEN
jgi:predicted  nucleic acid-binding Zn-ribbon protein